MNKPFITVSNGLRGWFAVNMWWNPEHDGFYEPWNTGCGSYETREGAIKEAKAWAEADGIDLDPNLK